MGRQPVGYLALAQVYFVIAWLLVANRLWVRHYHQYHTTCSRLSDGLVAAASVFIVPVMILEFYMFSTRTFVRDAYDHVEDTDPHTARIFSRSIFAENMLYYLPFYCVKVGILLFLMEVTPAAYRKLRVAIWVGIALCVILLVLTEVTIFMACEVLGVPFEWDSMYVRTWLKTCITTTPCIVIIIGSHMFTDIYIYIIPFFLLGHLRRTPRSQRLAAYGMLFAGLVVVFIAFIQTPLFSLDDQNWWAIHEELFMYAVACLPALRITITHLISRRRGRLNRSMPRRITLADKMRRGQLTTMEVAQQPDDEDGITSTHEGNTTLVTEDKDAIGLGTFKSVRTAEV